MGVREGLSGTKSIPDTTLGPRKTALLVIDMQNDFCSDQGVYGRSGFSRQLVQAMARRLERFLKTAREVGIPLIHTKTVHSEWTDNPVWLSREGGKYSHQTCRIGSWGAEWFEDFPGMWPMEGEYTVIKHRNSAFLSTDLELVLKSKEINSLIVTGTATNSCVEATGRDAFMRGYNVTVVSDCTATSPESAHSNTLERLQGSGILVSSSSDIINSWKKI